MDDTKSPSTTTTTQIMTSTIDEEKASSQISPSSSQFDEALKILTLTDLSPGTSTSLDAEIEKKLLRKIDWHIMPLMCVIYGIQFSDKIAISYGAIMGMQKSVGYTSFEYSWIASIFYFGYLVVEWPTNYLIQRLPLAKYIGTSIILWGLTLTLTILCTSYKSLLAVRFFLGCFEAGVTPAFTIFTSQWYKSHEQSTRTGLWFSCNGLGVIITAALTYLIYNSTLHHPPSIEAWKITFLYLGLTTMFLGILFLILMPDSPTTARFLSPHERIQAIERIRSNQQGIGNKTYKIYQVREALTDPLTWAFCVFAVSYNITNGGLTNFFGLLIKGLGYTTSQTLLYQMPGGAMQVVLMPLLLWAGDRWNNRVLITSTTLVTGIMGASMLAFVKDNNTARLAGYYFTNVTSTPFVALLSCIGTNVAGHTKKTTVAALYLISYCVGNIIGPQTFTNPPGYLPAEITIIVCYSVCLVDAVFIVQYYKLQNRRKAAVRAAPGYTKVVGQEFMDLTDHENPELIYVL